MRCWFFWFYLPLIIAASSKCCFVEWSLICWECADLASCQANVSCRYCIPEAILTWYSHVLSHKPPAADFFISIYITPEDWTEVLVFNLREGKKKCWTSGMRQFNLSDWGGGGGLVGWIRSHGCHHTPTHAYTYDEGESASSQELQAYRKSSSLSVNKCCSFWKEKVKLLCAASPPPSTPDCRVSPSSKDPGKKRDVSPASVYHCLETLACWCNGCRESPQRVEGPKLCLTVFFFWKEYQVGMLKN